MPLQQSRRHAAFRANCHFTRPHKSIGADMLGQWNNWFPGWVLVYNPQLAEKYRMIERVVLPTFSHNNNYSRASPQTQGPEPLKNRLTLEAANVSLLSQLSGRLGRCLQLGSFCSSHCGQLPSSATAGSLWVVAAPDASVLCIVVHRVCVDTLLLPLLLFLFVLLLLRYWRRGRGGRC